MSVLGVSAMPWQRRVLDVACELDPLTGLPAYREVVFSTPRQSGKSILLLGLAVHRALLAQQMLAEGKPQRIAYSAQTGNDARRKMLEDWLPMLEASDFRHGIRKVRMAAGSETVLFAGGSMLQPIASTASAGHGRTVDLGIIDEAFNDVDDRREQSIIPAMVTVQSAQMYVTSTAGTDSSLYFRRKTDVGRLAVEAGTTQTLAYFEWSAPDELDLDDEDAWFDFMPALGLTQSVESIRHAKLTMLPDEFARAFGNRWTTVDAHVIPWEAWLACRNPGAVPEGSLHFALDVNPERSSASIVVASDGAPIPVEVVDIDAGLTWVADRLLGLRDRHGAGSVILDGAGPAGTLVPDLERAGLPIRVLGFAEMARACSAFFDRVVSGELAVKPHARLDDAVAAARKRMRGDAFVWARRDTTADISPLVAASLAVWAARGDPGPAIY